MSSSLSASPFAVLQAPRKPPLLPVSAVGDPAGWAAANRDALRATVLEHGVLLVRGLGLRDAAAVGAVFRALAGSGLMAEREAFAPRQTYAEGVYSSTKWPANQQMCMHHELSYTLEFPGMMMFACLTAPAGGGATTVSDAPTLLACDSSSRTCSTTRPGTARPVVPSRCPRSVRANAGCWRCTTTVRASRRPTGSGSSSRSAR